jgi:LmbE family N-acetylglucosaminyl deacetylase
MPASEGGSAVHELGTILGVWAHPDDETYLTAGLMAQAVRDGRRVVCITATRGEGGSMDEERWPPETMGEVREAELMRCFEILGVTEHHWLDLPDIDMDTALPEHGYEQVREIMADVQPDTVLTFGPDGMTGHVAHMSVSAWATRALGEVGKPGARVHYATYTEAWADEFVAMYNRFDVFRPGTPPISSPDEITIDFPLPPDLLEVKLRAIEAHDSQVGGMVEAFGEDIFRRAMKAEWFRLGAAKED